MPEQTTVYNYRSERQDIRKLNSKFYSMFSNRQTYNFIANSKNYYCITVVRCYNLWKNYWADRRINNEQRMMHMFDSEIFDINDSINRSTTEVLITETSKYHTSQPFSNCSLAQLCFGLHFYDSRLTPTVQRKFLIFSTDALKNYFQHIQHRRD
jgi:hypothetical protein